MHSRIVVGLAGIAGSGKTAAAVVFREKYGFYIIDADQAGHRALELEKETLVRRFGPSVLSQGEVDRTVLGDIVFQNPKQLLLLNSIVHPQINKIVAETLESVHGNALIDAALLYEIGLNSLCDFVLKTEAPIADCVRRLVEHRNWDPSRAESVIRSQENLRFNRKKTDFILFNNGPMEKLERQIEIFVNIVM